MRKTLLILTFTFFLSCGNGGYEQYYANYKDFKKITNKRLNGWFPEIITRDSYQIRNTSYLDICAFTSVQYRNKSNVDSIFNSYKSVPVLEFKSVAEKYKERIPEWFVNVESNEKQSFDVVQLNNHIWALREKNKNRIVTISSLKYE